jgi:hypothetical protein
VSVIVNISPGLHVPLVVELYAVPPLFVIVICVTPETRSAVGTIVVFVVKRYAANVLSWGTLFCGSDIKKGFKEVCLCRRKLSTGSKAALVRGL